MNLKTISATTFTALTAMAVALAVLVNGEAPKANDGKDQVKPAVVKEVKKEEKVNIPTYLQDISVTIHANGSQGSGVISTRDGVNYVLTAAHVVSDLRKTRPIIDPKTGGARVKIEFDDAKVVKEIYDDEGRSVGRLMMDAEVIRYSDADNGEDLALLRLRKKDFVKVTAKFDCTGTKVPVGTDLIHVGSLLGQMGSNSLTTGVVSQHGRVVRGTVYDQSTCAAFRGSSGGGIYKKNDGVYVGMIVRGAGETFNLYVPMRRIQKWADRVGVEFALNPDKAVPDEKELRKLPVEEVGGEDPRAKADAKPKPHDIHDTKYPFLILRHEDAKKSRKITLEW